MTLTLCQMQAHKPQYFIHYWNYTKFPLGIWKQQQLHTEVAHGSTREEFTRSSEYEPQNSLISSWLPFSMPLHLFKTSQYCRASERSTGFPKKHPGSYCVEAMVHSKVRIWLTITIPKESYNYIQVTTMCFLQSESQNATYPRPLKWYTSKFWDSPHQTGNL